MHSRPIIRHAVGLSCQHSKLPNGGTSCQTFGEHVCCAYPARLWRSVWIVDHNGTVEWAQRLVPKALAKFCAWNTCEFSDDLELEGGAAPRAPGGARHGGGNRAVTSQPRTGQSTSCGDVKSLYGGAGGWDRRGCATGAPRSANRQGEEQHRHTNRGSHTRRDKGEHSRQGGGAQRGRRGNQNSRNREPEWRGWESVRMGGSDNKGDGLASQPCRCRVPGQPLLNQHQVGGVSRSPDGLFVQQEREPIRGRPAVRGKRTYGGRPGQRVEEQGTWASCTQKQCEAGYGRPVDRGSWTAKPVKRPRQQPAHSQYANYWARLTRKRHTMPHSAQPQHTNYWAPQTRKRHQQEHRPQRPAESSDPTQHAKGRTGDCPGPCKGTTTRRNVTQGVVGGGGMALLFPFFGFKHITAPPPEGCCATTGLSTNTGALWMRMR